MLSFWRRERKAVAGVVSDEGYLEPDLGCALLAGEQGLFAESEHKMKDEKEGKRPPLTSVWGTRTEGADFPS